MCRSTGASAGTHTATNTPENAYVIRKLFNLFLHKLKRLTFISTKILCLCLWVWESKLLTKKSPWLISFNSEKVIHFCELKIFGYYKKRYCRYFRMITLLHISALNTISSKVSFFLQSFHNLQIAEALALSRQFRCCLSWQPLSSPFNRLSLWPSLWSVQQACAPT